MLKSLYTTATGMKAQQTMVDMIANNIANVNTAGFKKSQASFEDLFYVTLQSPGLARGAGDAAVPIGTQIGSGTRLNGTTKVFTTGTLEITERTLDVAIDGEGFFALAAPGAGVQAVQAVKVDTGLGFRVLRSAGHFSYESGTDEYHLSFLQGQDWLLRDGCWMEIRWDGGMSVIDSIGRKI